MAVKAFSKNHSGMSLLELLLSMLILGIVSSAIFTSIRAIGALRLQTRDFVKQESSRTILKNIYSQALCAASQFLPQPLYAIDREASAPPSLQTQSETLTVAEAYPDAIFQRARSTGNGNLFCRNRSPLPEQENSSSLLAVGLGVSSRSIIKYRAEHLSGSSRICAEGTAVNIEHDAYDTPLLKTDAPPSKVEAIIPLRDLYTLYLDANSNLRRYSSATGEHQTVMRGIKNLELRAVSQGALLQIKARFSENSQDEIIFLPLASHNRVDWLDLIW